MSTIRLTVGMRGVHATIDFIVAAPSGVSWLVDMPAITAKLTPPTGSGADIVNITDADVTWSEITATSARATYVPDGTEITVPGLWTVSTKVVAGGDTIDFDSVQVRAKDNRRID